MSNTRPVGGRLVSAAILFFAPLAVLCVLLILKRLVFGIGSVTALNGGYPWGLWIAFDLLVGTGFACGGWALAWTVEISRPCTPSIACKFIRLFTRWSMYHHLYG